MDGLFQKIQILIPCYILFETFLKSILGESYQERKKREVVVQGTEDVNAPLYRNSIGYKIEISGGKIKQMTVHCYYTDC